LKESLYHLTNPKLNFWMDLLRGQIEKKKWKYNRLIWYFLAVNYRRKSLPFFHLGLVLVSRTLYAKFLFDYFKEYDDIVKPCWSKCCWLSK
jgi:hypothetical protein